MEDKNKVDSYLIHADKLIEFKNSVVKSLEWWGKTWVAKVSVIEMLIIRYYIWRLEVGLKKYGAKKDVQ